MPFGLAPPVPPLTHGPGRMQKQYQCRRNFPCPYKHCIKANYVREFVSYLLSTVTNQSWKELLSLMHMKCPMNSRVRTGNRVKITNRSLPTFCQMLIPCK